MKTLLTIAALLVAAPVFGAEPPPIKGYASAKQVADLEARIAELERKLAPKSPPGQVTNEGEPWEGSREQKAVQELMAELERKMKQGDYSTPLKFPCVCAAACACAEGVCPACPVAKVAPVQVPNPASVLPATLVIEGRVHTRGTDGVYYPTGSAPTAYPGAPTIVRTGGAQNCPTGKCPVR